ncbi:MAG: class I SAM-dependent methyltransferase [Gammaproteobacteria bacterium]|nr:MAG: class I SAM-dependent methyltransferase [Gammaproteobacteria bacterium]TLZ24684.1 MAG: class I SAM-dependent methyltransferase [Gammaproteobacteria bacterium]
MSCRICGASATRTVLDLGVSPPANSLLDRPDESQNCFPLVLEHCPHCANLQLRDCLDATELYRNYLYVTPDSRALQEHYEQLHHYLTARGYLAPQAFVLEVGSNVGLLLQYLQRKGFKVLGIDAAANICRMARDAGVNTICDFLGVTSARAIRDTYGMPDLLIARHCLAHNADPHAMIAAAAELLDKSAHLVIENAYALNTVENNEFDQIYHEHMFYYSVRSMQTLLASHGMHLVDVFLTPVHGGSIVFIAKRKSPDDHLAPEVESLAVREDQALTATAFERFAANAAGIRRSLRTLITELTSRGHDIYTYGATAKGNTLLNYVGLTREDIRYCVDSTTIKQGKYLPQSRIEVISEESAYASAPDYFLLTAWNYKEEIIAKVRQAGNRRSRFILPIPSVHIV